MENLLKVTLKKSMIGNQKSIKATLYGLGLTRINKTVSRIDTPEIRGMIKKVQHLVSVEE
ncbi:MAG: 50S ribosomal protein L30 [Deltaproteobacteria bacterium RIFOXYD12_FULL_50_9]|nr:MAG: 50S ribosomal protein L30 [Candidatus Curtissbacteria bacterium RIFOXYB12_FULL_40_6]OGR01764.1 MAG: 50S ribosomal protein L30 [Deltaproteobacteria bacterium RIFOXYD12_FULL_50_9]